jgi:pimeloyl-ACP methyl ester carboxylesterase
MPFIHLRTGVRVYYEVAGSGEPLLLIMGTGADHSSWDAQVAAYAGRFSVITYDQRGTGRSDVPPDAAAYSMRVLADDAAALLEALAVESAHVSGLSLGSAVAQELVLGHPAKVRSLQLHCTWGRTDEWLARLFDDMAFPLLHGDVEHFARTALMWVMSPTFLNDEPEALEERERGFSPENPSAPSIEGLLGHLHADRTHDALDRLHEIRVRTLITSGELDWQVPTRYGRAVHDRISGSSLHVFPGPRSSHCAFVEMADEFNERTLAFLDEQRGR